jgi:hypothetical protein
MKNQFVALISAVVLVAACQSPETKTPATPPSDGAQATDKAAESPEKAAESPAKAAAADDKNSDGVKAPEASPTSASAQPTESTGHFGAPFTSNENAKALSSIITAHKDHEGKTVKVSGTVSTVCKKKGCWMVLKSDKPEQQSVRITMKDYGFFAPKDCDGKKAVVEGVLGTKEVGEKMRKHLAEDQGKDPSTVTGSTVELRIVATGLTITKG